MKNLKFIPLLIAAVLLGGAAMAAGTAAPSGGGHNTVLVVVAIVQVIAILALVGILKRFATHADQYTTLRRGGRNAKKTLTIAALLTVGLSARAQESHYVPEFPAFATDANTVVLLLVNALLLFVILYLAAMLKKMVNRMTPDFKEEMTTLTPQGSVKIVEERHTTKEQGSSFLKSLTDAVPLEREDDVMLDHEYDGIRELDNNLPPWWVWMFWATIIFAVVYFTWYEILPYGMTQTEEYHAEMAKAEADREAYLATQERPVDENTVELLTDPSDLAAGKKIYVANCEACHAPDGGGGVGPNFCDEYWVHGGSINDIFAVIKYGVPQKGMISWESQLRPEEIAQVASYVKSFEGTTPLAPKEPQGEIWKPKEKIDEAAAADTTATEVVVPGPGENDSNETEEKATSAIP